MRLRNSPLSIGFSEKEFVEALALNVATVGVRPVDAVEQLLTQTLVENIQQSAALMLRKTPSVKLHPAYFKERCASLAQLADGGYEQGMKVFFDILGPSLQFSGGCGKEAGRYIGKREIGKFDVAVRFRDGRQ
jgi:hypothetical protein